MQARNWHIRQKLYIINQDIITYESTLLDYEGSEILLGGCHYETIRQIAKNNKAKKTAKTRSKQVKPGSSSRNSKKSNTKSAKPKTKSEAKSKDRIVTRFVECGDPSCSMKHKVTSNSNNNKFDPKNVNWGYDNFRYNQINFTDIAYLTEQQNNINRLREESQKARERQMWEERFYQWNNNIEDNNNNNNNNIREEEKEDIGPEILLNTNFKDPYHHLSEEFWSMQYEGNTLDNVIKAKNYIEEKVSDLAKRYPKVAKAIKFAPPAIRTATGIARGFALGGPIGAVVGGLAGLESGIYDMIMIEAINHTIGNNKVKDWASRRAANIVTYLDSEIPFELAKARTEFFVDIFQIIATSKVYSKINNLPPSLKGLKPNALDPIKYRYKKIPQDGLERASMYSNQWPKASLKDAIKKFAPEAEVINTASGKTIYKNSSTGIQIVYDNKGNYFRIENTNLSIKARRKYLDLNGKIPNNKVLNNKISGRSDIEYHQVTHFNNTDN